MTAALRPDCRLCGGRTWKSVARRRPDGGVSFTRKCVRCKQWITARGNAGRARRHEYQPKFLLNRREFAAWAESAPRVCHVCTIPERLLEALDVRTENNVPLRWLGLDRLNGGDYALDNVSWCCYPCNATRSNRFSLDEMRRILGPALRKIWVERLRAAGIDDPWVIAEENER